MLKFIKQIFVSTIMFFGCLSNVNPLKCVSMNNRECKIRTKIVNVNSNEPYFILLVLKQGNVVVVVTISIIPIQNCVFLMLLKV